MPHFQKLSIEGLILITPDRFGDERSIRQRSVTERLSVMRQTKDKAVKRQ